MHVAVLLLFVGCFAGFYHFNVEVQSLARQRVVGIDGNGFVANFYYTNDLGGPPGVCAWNCMPGSMVSTPSKAERGTGWMSSSFTSP